ncbi:MAG TPA: dihydrofolate reductase family protein [Streptosporangiaceae bacterium]|nr:dihydrofolate reductase family protein [Streptosporangiaceae bacterium]
MRQIYPVQGPELPLVPAATAGPLPAAVLTLADLYGNGASSPPASRHLRANMVASTDGAASLAGRSGGLSGAGDRMVFTVLRSLSDLVLVGAGTARAERYRPAQSAGLWTGLRAAGAPPPAIAVVTASLQLDPDALLLTSAAEGAQTIVITTSAAPAARREALARHARIIEAGEKQVDVTKAIGELERLGYSRILCEGGPTLLGQLAGAGLVDELCLTTSPVLAAGPAGRIVSAPPATDATAGFAAGTAMPATPTAAVAARLSLAHVLADDSFLFSRYLREH